MRGAKCVGRFIGVWRIVDIIVFEIVFGSMDVDGVKEGWIASMSF